MKDGAAQLNQVQKEIQRASHAPGYVYASKEIYQKEIDEYFMKDWLFVGREEELPNPGDFMTMRLVGEPIVIARDRTGQLNAFYNMCAHRGVEVACGQGNARALMCPYHGWTYEMDGKLRGASYMTDCEGFDRSQVRLTPIRFATWRRNMFVCFSDETVPLEEYVKDVEADFGTTLQMEKARLGVKSVVELECNWKLVYENLMDFYHVRVLHAKTFGSRVSWGANDWKLENDGIFIEYKAAPSTPDGEPLAGRLPWLHDRDNSFAVERFLWPNLTLFGRIDAARPFVVWPLSESRCQVIIYHCFAEEVFERPDREEIFESYRSYMLRVLDEDRSMIESLQRAMSCRGFKPGRMSVMERPIHHVLNSYIERLLK
jgi:Rieske 2Fe-2S family protein